MDRKENLNMFNLKTERTISHGIRISGLYSLIFCVPKPLMFVYMLPDSFHLNRYRYLVNNTTNISNDVY